jgi:23S rRNA (cytidine1920-2'-O)/16S rRNA (cytidine1409-2'-O)-methyltransferase
MARMRLDVLVAERGLADSRERAQRLIMAGQVEVAGHVVDKPSQRVDADIDCRVREPPRFVSRGGEKLAAALETFAVSVAGRVCLDAGSSTGGFTDCLLQHGATRVYAVDVGRGQLDWRLRQDARVVVMEGVNARNLTAAGPFEPPPSLAVADVAFISLTKVLPAIIDVMACEGHLVTLIKPQFEAGRADVGKGGVVRDAAVHARVVETIRSFGVGQLGLAWLGVCESPLRGPAGNVEFLAYWRKTPQGAA